MSNRYTVVKPTEFVQTYDPYPFEEMFKMAQYKQGRADQASLVAGKLAGETAIESGYFTGDAAAQIMKEREADLNKVTQIAFTGNMAATNRAYAEALTRWQKNPMLQSIQSDVEQKKFVDAQLASKGYGNDYMFNTYDSNTGTFTPSEATKAKIASGQKLTLHDYGGIENVADIKAYSPYIDKVKADQFSDYEMIDGVFKEKTSGAVLDYDTIRNRSTFLDSFKKEDGSINMELLKATDPELYKNARWKQAAYEREGRTEGFKWNDLVNDYMDIASLSFNIQSKRDITGMGKGSSGSGDEQQVSAVPLIPMGEIDYNVSTATNTPAVEIKTLNTAATAVGVDPFSFKDKSTGYSIDDMTYKPSVNLLPEERRKYDVSYQEKQQNIYSSTFNAIHNKLKAENKPIKMPDGSFQYKTDPSEIESKAKQDTEALLLKRRKLAKAKNDTELEVLSQGYSVPPPSSEKLKSEMESDPLLMKAQKYSSALEERQNLIDAFSAGTLDITDRELDKRAKDIVLNKIKPNSLSPLDVVKLNASYEEVNGTFVPKKYSKYFQTLNKNIEDSFGQEERTTTGYMIMKSTGDLSAAKDIPISHKIINDAAIGRIESGKGVYFKGMPLNAIDEEGTRSTKGQNIGQLYVAGTEDDTHDFSNGTYVPDQFYFDNLNDKWMVRGKFTTSEDGKVIKSAMYDVDVTQNMQQFMTDPQFKEVIAADRAVDIIEGTYKGTSTVAKFGQPDDIRGEYGDVIVSVTPTGGYSIAGKVFDPSKGKVRNITDILVENGENPLKLTKDAAKGHLASIFKNQMYYSENKGNVGSTTLEIPEELKPDVNNALNVISSYESGGNTGEYNAMNQGGTDGGRVAINPGNSTSILGKPLVGMTIEEVMEQQKKGNLHAAGKYQFIKGTLAEFVEKAGIPLTSRFDAATQDRLALELIKEVAVSSYSVGDLKSKLKGRWIGLQNASDAELTSLAQSAFNIGRSYQ